MLEVSWRWNSNGGMSLMNKDAQKYIDSLTPVIKNVEANSKRIANEFVKTLFETSGREMNIEFDPKTQMIVFDYTIHDAIRDYIPSFIEHKVTDLSMYCDDNVLIVHKNNTLFNSIF
jgi:hypothetical protein